MEEINDLAGKYYNSYNGIVRTTNKVAGITFLIILFSWVYLIEGIYQKEKKNKEDVENKIKPIEADIKNLKSELKNSRYYDVTVPLYKYIVSEDLQTNKKSDSARKKIESYKKITDSIQRKEARDFVEHQYAKAAHLKDSIAYLKKQGKHFTDSTESELKSVVSEVPFPFKTLFFFTGNIRNGPQSLIVIITCLIIYTFLTRRSALRYLAKSIRFWQSSNFIGLKKYKDVNISAPFWLAPISRRKNIQLDRNYLRDVIDWKYSAWYFHVMTGLILAILIVIEFRQLFLSIIYSRGTNNIQFYVNVLLIGISIALSVLWQIPDTIQDSFNSESSAANDSRRNFIISFAGLVALYPFFQISKKVPKWFIGNKYIKAKKLDFDLRLIKNRNWYRHSKSGKLYFFDHNGYNPALYHFKNKAKLIKNKTVLIKDNSELKLFLNRLTEFDPARISLDLYKRKICRENRDWQAEKTAITILGNSKNDNRFCEACEVLMERLQRNSNKIRLWDLFAIICSRYNLRDPRLITTLEAAILVQKQRLFGENLLVHRFEKFADKKWQTKIATKKIIYWDRVKI